MTNDTKINEIYEQEWTQKTVILGVCDAPSLAFEVTDFNLKLTEFINFRPVVDINPNVSNSAPSERSEQGGPHITR